MPHVFRKNTFIAGLILLFLAGMSGLSEAALSMDKVQHLFEKETGAQWGKATSEERRTFIQDIQGREELKGEVKYKGKKKRNAAAPPRTVEGSILSKKRDEKAPFPVRESFEKERGMAWEGATEEEQKDFWKAYKKKEAAQKKKEAADLRNKKRREAAKIRARQAEEKSKLRKKQAREKKKQAKLRAERKKRIKERKKLEKQKKKLELMRRRSSRR